MDDDQQNVGKQFSWPGSIRQALLEDSRKSASQAFHCLATTNPGNMTGDETAAATNRLFGPIDGVTLIVLLNDQAVAELEHRLDGIANLATFGTKGVVVNDFCDPIGIVRHHRLDVDAKVGRNPVF